MTYSFDLLCFEPSRREVAGTFAQLYVKTHTGDKKGNILITPRCVSSAEVDEQIERLREELEIIRRKAKQKFVKSRQIEQSG